MSWRRRLLVSFLTFAGSPTLVAFIAGCESPAMGREQAVEIANDFNAENPAAVPTTNTAAPGAVATATPTNITLRSAELIETGAPAITGDQKRLVWLVKLGGTHPLGKIRATIYIDTRSGEVPTHLVC